MSRDNTTEGSHSSEIKLTSRSTTNTQSFFESCVLDADHKALEEHLVNSPLQQMDLDRCLLRGLRIVQREERALSHVAPALTLLLQFGAKWNSDALLDEQKTPYHIICESPGDHHELLDLMIKSSHQKITNARDSRRCTAVMWAVQNANINCLKCLIASGVDVNIGDDRTLLTVMGTPAQEVTAIIQIIRGVCGSTSKFTSVHEDMFELLLDNSPIESYMTLLLVAIEDRNVYFAKKLIEKGARLDFIVHGKCYVWSTIALLGDIELVKCMMNHGIDKDCTDHNGLSILWYVVTSGNVEVVRYLLDIGVEIPTTTPEERETQCEQCKENRLLLEDDSQDPCLAAMCDLSYGLEIVKLLEENGSQSYKSFEALRHAILYDNVEVTLYLLNNYTYPLNIEYVTESDPSGSVYTLLTEPILSTRKKFSARIRKLLLDHGADPAKQMCSATSANAIMTAIAHGDLEVIAQYIRSGVDINFKSYDCTYGKVLPFEASVLRRYHNVAQIFLISGCSCGVFSLDNNHKFKNNLTPEVEKLMEEWKVQENNVPPLQQRCRTVILNHLSPQADKKIEKLPLPEFLINFLCISEIDEIVDAQIEH